MSVPLVAHNSTYLYPAVSSMLSQLFEIHSVCRHETYPVTIFPITFSFPAWVCAVLQIGYTSVAILSSRITKVKTISVQVGFLVERETLGHPPPINFICPTQYHSTTYVCLRLTHLPQKLYDLVVTRHLSSSLLVSLVITFCDVIKQLIGVESAPLLSNSRSGENV